MVATFGAGAGVLQAVASERGGAAFWGLGFMVWASSQPMVLK